MQKAIQPTTYLHKPLRLSAATNRQPLDRKIESGVIFYGEEQFLKGKNTIRFPARPFAKFVDKNPSLEKFEAIHKAFVRMMQPVQVIQIDENGKLRFDKKTKITNLIRDVEADWENDYIQIEYHPTEAHAIKNAIIRDAKTQSITLNFIAQARLPNRGPSLAGYHLFSQFRPSLNSKKVITSPKMELAVIREHFNKHGKTWQNYRHLKARVLNPAIKTINENTDLHVQMHEIRQGRSVAFLWFEVSNNSNFSTHRPDKAKLARILNKYGVAPSTTDEILNNPKIPSNLIYEAIQALKDLKDLKDPENPPGFLVKAIKNGWKANPKKPSKHQTSFLKSNLEANEIEAHNRKHDQQNKELTDLRTELEPTFNQLTPKEQNQIKTEFATTLSCQVEKAKFAEDTFSILTRHRFLRFLKSYKS